jgi:putative radical SAM enzyme (TIGR03279 family)
LTAKGHISRVAADSIAEELELAPGDKVIAVDGSPVTDIIDLSFALAAESLELLIEKANGDQLILEIDKEYDEDLGLEFESAVFDCVRQCGNKCLFCFVDQMPPGLRQSLYVKDDDYRLSFLYGNFITLTNLTAADRKRIRQLHLSPLYVSVHATDKELRAVMIGNPRAKDIMLQLKELVGFGVELHTQVVLCPGFNDGPALAKTIADLWSLRPGVLSLAIVPVGVTRHRSFCQELEGFSPEAAAAVIEAVDGWQKSCRSESGSAFVYLADEFYLAANRPIPEYDDYDGFPQLENGVGIVRNFLSEWAEHEFSGAGYSEPLRLDVVCGTSIEKILRPLLAALNIANLTVRVVPVENRFFGSSITVTGLLTGQDIIAALSAIGGQRDGIILPGIALRKGENVFLDGATVDDVAARLGTTTRVAYFAADLAQQLAAWR